MLFKAAWFIENDARASSPKSLPKNMQNNAKLLFCIEVLCFISWIWWYETKFGTSQSSKVILTKITYINSINYTNFQFAKMSGTVWFFFHCLSYTYIKVTQFQIDLEIFENWNLKQSVCILKFFSLGGKDLCFGIFSGG